MTLDQSPTQFEMAVLGGGVSPEIILLRAAATRAGDRGSCSYGELTDYLRLRR